MQQQHEFGSKEWAEAVASEIEEKGWDGFQDVRNVARTKIIGGICNARYDEGEIRGALDGMSDAAMVMDMLRSNHPLLHELAHQTLDYKVPSQVRGARAFKKLVKSVPGRFLDMGPSKRHRLDSSLDSSSDGEEEAPQPTKEEILSSQKRIRGKVLRNNLMFRHVMRHPRTRRFAKASWYTDQYGMMVKDRVTTRTGGWLKKFAQRLFKDPRIGFPVRCDDYDGVDTYNLAQCVKFRHPGWKERLVSHLTK